MPKKMIEPTIYTLDIPLYYSGFCLTDNSNFSEFYLNRIPKLNYQFKEFKFTEENLIYELEEDEVEEEELQAVSRSQELNRKSRVIREAEKVFDDIINPAA